MNPIFSALRNFLGKMLEPPSGAGMLHIIFTFQLYLQAVANKNASREEWYFKVHDDSHFSYLTFRQVARRFRRNT